jgi:hypothetical protein
MNNWRMQYDPWGVYQGAAFPFGAPSSGVIMTAMPEVSSPDSRTDDTDNPRGDGLQMGLDSLGGTTISFEMEVSAETKDLGDEYADELRRVWRGDPVRTRPGAVATLTSHNGRSAFGRPRRYSADDTRSHVGRRSVTADFRTVDDLWYGAEDLTQISLNPPLGGGLVAPLRAPLTTTASSSRVQTFRVGGRVPTRWLVIDIYGDIANPDIEIPGVLRQRFTTSLAYDQTLRVDARPWSRKIMKNAAAIPGALTRDSTRLGDLLLPPGEYQLILRGTSLSGTARAVLRWRDAFTTY